MKDCSHIQPAIDRQHKNKKSCQHFMSPHTIVFHTQTLFRLLERLIFNITFYSLSTYFSYISICYNNKNNRSSVSYARYQLAVKIQRYLTNNEFADHIDNDKTNDDINNLQILTRKENNLKSSKGVTWIDMICPKCNKNFKKELRQYRHNHHCCSRSCGSKKLI
jgi:hypothetical protein